MITERVLDWLLGILGNFLNDIFTSNGTLVTGYIYIPEPLFWMFQAVLQPLIVVYPLAFAWWVWRQIKA